MTLQPAFSDVRPVKAGKLFKQGHKFKSWKQRLFLAEGKYLYYYLHELDVKPRGKCLLCGDISAMHDLSFIMLSGVISLDECVVQAEPEMTARREASCFSIKAVKSWNIDLAEEYFGELLHMHCAMDVTIALCILGVCE